MSSGVHEPLAATFIEQFGVAKAFLSPANRKQLAIVGAQEVGSFQGSYQSSSKEPDALFVYPPPNGPISYTCAVEVGFSERYEDLVEDIRLWIEGARMRMVILINVDEAPRYRCPTYGLQDDEIEDLELPAIRALNTSMVSLEDKTDRFGPLQMHGLTWVNKMNAFLEIWKPDGITGEAKQEGDRKVSYTPFMYTTYIDSSTCKRSLWVQITCMNLRNLISDSVIYTLSLMQMEVIRGSQ